MKCRHYRESPPVTCDAFPERIPDRIWLEGDPHTAPVPGDHGIRFEPKTSETGIEEPDFTAEDLAIMDRVWAEIAAEDRARGSG
jgi:hypothetical protein